MELDLFPRKFKVNDPKLKDKALSSQVQRVVLEDALTKAARELRDAQYVYSVLIKDVNLQLSLAEIISLNALLCKRYDQQEKNARARHRKKLFNLWSRQSKFSPDCITNLSSKELTLQEYNALHFGL